MVEIHQSEIEALIQHRLSVGGFASVEDVLFQALQDAPLPVRNGPSASATLSGEEIIAAFQRCPVKDFEFEPERIYSAVSDPVQFQCRIF